MDVYEDWLRQWSSYTGMEEYWGHGNGWIPRWTHAKKFMSFDEWNIFNDPNRDHMCMQDFRMRKWHKRDRYRHNHKILHWMWKDYDGRSFIRERLKQKKKLMLQCSKRGGDDLPLHLENESEERELNHRP